jgi:predicted site-specific integrase-resolvase
VVSTRQAARRLGVTERQVQRYVHAGLLEAQQLGDHSTAPWMITDESLERLIALQAAEPHRFRRRARPADVSPDSKGA